jgi:3-oxoacyl-[acyl-carrier protein] reductase
MRAMRNDRVALITGAGRGIGRAIALGLADECRAVAVHYHRDQAAAEAAARSVRAEGAESFVVRADLSREADAVRVVRAVEKRFGRLDILVNNVGPFLMKPWVRLTAADWEAMFRGNLLASFFTLRAALPGMKRRGWGRIVNVGFGRVEQAAAFPTVTAYAAAKSALLILTRTAAATEAGTGVTVNMVSPGLIKGGRLPRGAKVSPASLGTREDVARAVRDLVSDGAAAVSGTNLLVAATWKM